MCCSPYIISHEIKEDEMVEPCSNMGEMGNEIGTCEEIVSGMVGVDGRIL